MFKQTQNGYNIPVPGTVERMEARQATRGGGWILDLQVNGRSETMVFSTSEILTQTLMAMLNGAVLAQMAAEAQKIRDNPPPADVSQMQTQQVGAGAQLPVAVELPKRKGGRPKGAKLTDEQKAAMKASRAAKKAGSANIPNEEKQAA